MCLLRPIFIYIYFEDIYGNASFPQPGIDRKSNQNWNSMIIIYNLFMYILLQTTLLVEDDPISQIILCGQVVSTPEVHQLFLRRNPHVSASIKLKMTLFILTVRFLSSWEMTIGWIIYYCRLFIKWTITNTLKHLRKNPNGHRKTNFHEYLWKVTNNLDDNGFKVFELRKPIYSHKN